MINIKTFKLFESDSYDDIKINCEDILLDMSDSDILVDVNYNKKQMSHKHNKDLLIKIGSERSSDPIKLGEYADTIKRLLSYLNDNGYKLSQESFCLNDSWGSSECCPVCRSQSLIMPDGYESDKLKCNNCNYDGDLDDFLTSEHPIKDDIIWYLDKNYYVYHLSLIFTR